MTAGTRDGMTALLHGELDQQRRKKRRRQHARRSTLFLYGCTTHPQLAQLTLTQDSTQPADYGSSANPSLNLPFFPSILTITRTGRLAGTLRGTQTQHCHDPGAALCGPRLGPGGLSVVLALAGQLSKFQQRPPLNRLPNSHRLSSLSSILAIALGQTRGMA